MELERKKIEGGCCVGGGAPCNDKSTSGINIRCIPHLHNRALIEIDLLLNQLFISISHLTSLNISSVVRNGAYLWFLCLVLFVVGSQLSDCFTGILDLGKTFRKVLVLTQESSQIQAIPGHSDLSCKTTHKVFSWSSKCHLFPFCPVYSFCSLPQFLQPENGPISIPNPSCTKNWISRLSTF